MQVKKKSKDNLRNNILKVSVPIIIGFFLLYFVLKNFNFSELFDILKNANIFLIILYFVISVLLILCSVYRWKIVLLSQKHKIKFSYLLKSFLAGYAISYMTPSAKLGGEPVRAALLHKKGLKIHQSLSSIIIDKTLELGSSLFFFIIGGILLILNYALPNNLKFLIIILSIIFMAIIGFAIYQIINEKGFILSIYKFFKLHKYKKFEKMTKRLIDIEKIMIKFYKRDSKHFFIALFIMALAWGFMFAEFKIAALIFGFDANLIQIFLTFSLVGAAYIIPVPFAIGTLEGGQVALFKAIKVNPAIGLGIGLITRVRDTLTAIIGLFIAIYYGVASTKKISKSAKFNKDVFKN
jgi:hypothetical protein